MSRYIDAKELMRLLQNYRPFVESGRFNELQIQANQLVDCIEYEIEEAPSIDIVRCKECKWGKPYSDKQLECGALGLGGLKFPDDFCSFGERKESE